MVLGLQRLEVGEGFVPAGLLEPLHHFLDLATGILQDGVVRALGLQKLQYLISIIDRSVVHRCNDHGQLAPFILEYLPHLLRERGVDVRDDHHGVLPVTVGLFS